MALSQSIRQSRRPDLNSRAVQRNSEAAGILGIDIGGANLKYATVAGRTHALPFPLWKRPHDLASQLQRDVGSFGDVRQLAVTMTGELADCFLDRGRGVAQIVAACRDAAARVGCDSVRFYGVDGRFHDPESACEQPDLIAAANWHALASHVAQRFAPSLDRGALLIDIGSTTTDLIPIARGSVATKSKTDYERLREGTLVYLGGERTPVCAVVDTLPFRGEAIPVMREVFATIDDVRLLTGHTAENPDDNDTADGAPRDCFHAANRLARMIGLDHRGVSIGDAVCLARQVHDRGIALITDALDRCRARGLVDGTEIWIISGHASDLLPTDRVSAGHIQLADVLGNDVARCAPAHAVACLLGDVGDQVD